jgi:hypothetical protein
MDVDEIVLHIELAKRDLESLTKQQEKLNEKI